MKNRYINIVYKRLIGVALTLAACSVVMVVANKMGYSEPSMGYATDEEAEYIQSLWNAGYSFEEIDRLQVEYEKEHHIGWYADDEPAPAQSQPSAQSEKTQPATKQNNTKETAKPSPAPTKTYSHDFDSITDEAREAFRAFTSDGQPNSCYLNIIGSSKDNIITGKELNATRTGKEDGKIIFGDNGDTRYEWIFSNWTSEDDFSLDLTSEFFKVSDTEYELVFKGSGLGDNNVSFSFYTGLPQTKLYFYTKAGEDFTEKYAIDTDDRGYATLNPVVLDKYTVSTVELGIPNEADEAKPEKTEETLESVETEPTPLPIPEEVANNKLVLDDEPAIQPYVIPIIVGVFVIILICAGVVIFKFMR